ncbi:MAG: hypothetical protein ACRD8K_09085 [Nitrososphaeraceae archaeon]
MDNSKVKRSTVIDCPRCGLINQLENKFCSKCSYPLKPEAYEELKEKEENEKRNETTNSNIDRIPKKEYGMSEIFRENYRNC